MAQVLSSLIELIQNQVCHVTENFLIPSSHKMNEGHGRERGERERERESMQFLLPTSFPRVTVRVTVMKVWGKF